MKRSTWIALLGGGVLAAGLLAWAFAPAPVEVEAVATARGPFETAVEEDGRTRVRERHAATAPIAGRLRRIPLREGDLVQAGQVLALIDPLPAALLDERARREQQARAAAARASLERAGTRVQAAQVGVEQALNEQRRTAQLVEQGFVSPAKADADRLAVEAAAHEREAAVESERVARFELQQARVALEWSSGAGLGPGAAAAAAPISPALPAERAFAVRASVAGQVLRVHQVSEGVVGIGTPLLDLADTSRIEVVAELLTSDAALARPGSPVRVERWGGPGVLQARVRRVEPAAFTKISALGVEEQRVNVLIDLDPQASTPALGDAWRVVVRILTRQEADVLRVPVSAVFPWPSGASNADAMGVFIVEGGRARLKQVQVGASNGSLAWVTAGLSPGDVVIAYPPPSVAEGVRVKAR